MDVNEEALSRYALMSGDLVLFTELLGSPTNWG